MVTSPLAECYWYSNHPQKFCKFNKKHHIAAHISCRDLIEFVDSRRGAPKHRYTSPDFPFDTAKGDGIFKNGTLDLGSIPSCRLAIQRIEVFRVFFSRYSRICFSYTVSNLSVLAKKLSLAKFISNQTSGIPRYKKTGRLRSCKVAMKIHPTWRLINHDKCRQMNR